MSGDLVLILIAYLLMWISLFGLLQICENKRKVVFIHLGIQFIYSVLFIVGFATSGPGGGVLAIIIFWPIFIGIHWFILLVFIAIKLIKRSKNNSLLQKLYDTVFFIFVIESILLLIAGFNEFIDYGKDIGGTLMLYGIAIAIGAMIIAKFTLGKLDSKLKQNIGVLQVAIMLFLLIYYLVEDHFSLWTDLF